MSNYENGALIIEPTGEASVRISPDGLPAFKALVPCPWSTPLIREPEVTKAVESVYMQGYYVTGQKLIHNEAFDKCSEKTTTQLSFRVCKTKDEAEFVLGKVKAIVEASMETKSE